MPPERWQAAGFGLYVHWPFCQAKCPYCDFNSHVVADIDQARWRDALVREIGRLAAETEGRLLSTIFFGGGTPSLMAPETVAAVIDAARSSWPMVNRPEITLEANPTSIEAGRFAGFRAAGVTRVSIGVQALNDPDLGRLGRLHSAAEARASVELAKRHFENVSFDLIYARQDQSLADWESELAQALDMATDHLSLYQLTIEDGTAFADRFRRGGLRGLPDEDLAADMYLLTQEKCEVAGLSGYEVSNHAADGAQSRHNLIYWRSGDWAAVGPGAHGRLTLGGQRWASEAHRAPGKWLNAVEEAGSGEHPRVALSQQEDTEERVMMGLRLREGIAQDTLGGLGLNSNKINDLVDDGLLESTQGRLRTTARGRPILNAVLREILA